MREDRLHYYRHTNTYTLALKSRGTDSPAVRLGTGTGSPQHTEHGKGTDSQKIAVTQKG